MNGTAVYGERVVIVQVYSGRVNLMTGRVSSADSSHIQLDNRNETGLLRDQEPAADGPEEVYERSFRMDDIHVLKEQEAHSLQDRNTAATWFGAIYQDRVVKSIHRALKRLKS